MSGHASRLAALSNVFRATPGTSHTIKRSFRRDRTILPDEIVTTHLCLCATAATLKIQYVQRIDQQLHQFHRHSATVSNVTPATVPKIMHIPGTSAQSQTEMSPRALVMSLLQ